MSDILFILKRREDFNELVHNTRGLSTGLLNSATFMVDMLNSDNITTEIEVAVDNNCIDRLVNLHKPTVVIIEALWVIPSKFALLSKLHPDVTWIIRLHSDMPFMALEGMSFEWIGDYLNHPNIVLAPNSPRMYKELQVYARSIHYNWPEDYLERKIVYLPNYYPIKPISKKLNKNKHWVDISCFGAVRPLKNHVMQAVAALEFAESLNKELRFHINIGRIEGGAHPALRNLQGMFEHLADKGHQLVGHNWMDRDAFVEVCSQMDIGMQVSFNETFNIVGADIISQGVPFVGSLDEIPWGSNYFMANPAESSSIVEALHRAYKWPRVNARLHTHNICSYSKKTRKIWAKYFKGY